MSVSKAIFACAASPALAEEALSAWQANREQLEALGADTDRRIASIVGQCAHESGGFRHRRENLNYSAASLQRVFRKYFSSQAEADQYARRPKEIANRVYANRMGNGDEASGDGWQFRGRGYIQLTGRDNYASYGKALGVDLLGRPELAADPATAWLLAVRYFATRRRSGKNLLEWADLGEERMVTLGINGGTNGLEDREIKVAKALKALSGATPVTEWQSLLTDAGFDPGPIDGLRGPSTNKAIRAAEAKFGMSGEQLADKLRAVVV